MKNKRVRIAVVMNDLGEYSASGWDNAGDKSIIDAAKDPFEHDGEAEHVVFVEADVPLPTVGVATVEGSVSSTP